MGTAMPRTTGRAGGARATRLGAGAGMVITPARQVSIGGSHSEVPPAATLLEGGLR